MVTPRVLFAQYANPAAYPPVVHAAELLAEAGFDVMVLGTGGDDRSLRWPERPAVRVEQLATPGSGWRVKSHYARFSAWALAHAARWRPDWIYASDAAVCPAVLAMQRVSGADVVYHEHDVPSPASGRASDVVGRARRLVAQRSACVVVPNAERADALREATNASTILTAWNCPMRHEVAPPKTATSSAPLRLLYHGSITPARVPLAVIDAIASCGEGVLLDIVGYATLGAPDYVDTLRRRAADRGVAERVRLCPPESRQALMLRCRLYDAGLALLPLDTTDLNEQTMVGASNKPFDYLAAGLALIVSARPEWQLAYVDDGYGAACDPSSVESIAGVVRHLMVNADARREMGERGRRRILDAWHYERTFAPVVDLMASRSTEPRLAARAAPSEAAIAREL